MKKVKKIAITTIVVVICCALPFATTCILLNGFEYTAERLKIDKGGIYGMASLIISLIWMFITMIGLFVAYEWLQKNWDYIRHGSTIDNKRIPF